MSNGKKREPSWNEASCELDEILREIESGSTDLDALHQRVERAAELIQLCRDKLGSTELKVRKVVDALSAEGADGTANDAARQIRSAPEDG
jgi:exodeoxyribonuclease VII small subunit